MKISNKKLITITNPERMIDKHKNPYLESIFTYRVSITEINTPSILQRLGNSLIHESINSTILGAYFGR